MGISTEILRIKDKISDTFISLSNKDVTVPDNSNSENLTELIESIPYYSCPNGTQWTQSNITEGDWHIVYGNGMYVACSTDSTRPVLYSTDGINWNTSNIAFRIYHTEALKYANGIWVLGGTYYSTDGINWIVNNIKNQYITNVEYANGVWICGSHIKYNALYYSIDGMTWNSTGIGGRLYYLKCINNMFFVCLNNVLSYSEDGITWNQCLNLMSSSSNIYQIIYAKGIYLTYDASYTGLLYYSSDGITWKNHGRIICSSIKALEYANGLFVASTNSGLQYSTNGLGWSQSNITETTNNEVHYINDVWFAYSYYNNMYKNYYSTDGMNWFESKLFLHRVINNNHGIWLTGNKNRIQYSTNYIDWNIALRNVICNELICEDNIWLASYATPYNFSFNTAQSNMGIWYSKVWDNLLVKLK